MFFKLLWENARAGCYVWFGMVSLLGISLAEKMVSIYAFMYIVNISLYTTNQGI